MKTFILPAWTIFVFAAGPWVLPCVTAQTNEPQFVTNLVSSPSDFRRVNGKLYNIQESALWEELELEFVNQEKGIVFARVVSREPLYETRWRRSNVTEDQRHGAYAGLGSHGSGYYKVKVGEEKELGRTIALRNCRLHDLTTGKEFTVIAMRAGTYPKDAGILELWDNGETNLVQVVTQTRLAATQNAQKRKATAAAASLKFNQEQAAKGDAYGQLRMGQRYLTGDGVEKDEGKAREFFALSAAQGNIEASNRLTTLKP